MDILTKERIALIDALKGCDLRVKTIHGLVTMKVPPGIQPGELRKLKGKGISDAYSGRQGDHIVELSVTIPQIPSHVAKAIEAALKNEGGGNDSSQANTQSVTETVLNVWDRAKRWLTSISSRDNMYILNH